MVSIKSIVLLSLFVVAASSAVFTFAMRSGHDWEFPREWFWHDDDAQREKHAALLAKQMPPLELSDWKNGELTAEQMKGKILVIDFWATWCGPCIASIPHNNELYKKYKDKGVELIGVCTANGQENYERIVATKNVEYPVARDANLTSAKAWEVMWYPTYAVVDRKGNVRAIGLQPAYVEKVIEALLDTTPKEEEPVKK